MINFDATGGAGNGQTDPVGDISNADATFDEETNNMYAASLGATHVTAGDADAVAITNAVAGSMYYEYQKSADMSIFGSLGADDGLGSA